MSVPVHTLSKDQKVWYARMVIAAILADDEISPSEVDFLKQVIAVVDNPDEKKSLLKMISSKEKPELDEPPSGIAKEILAAIFIELLLIMISDLDFADDEKVFLKEIAELFSFEPKYFKELMLWGEEGLDWKNSQQKLVSNSGKTENFQIPLGKLNSAQKKWYAQALIATIMLDGAVDEMELSFLKAAVSFVDNRKDQLELMGYVRNKMSPRLKSPPKMPKKVLILIFIEVMRIVSADETLSYAEHAHLKQISDLCEFPSEIFDRMIEWCNRGIAWMQNKTPLITNCKIVKKAQSSLKRGGGLKQNPDNNSIFDREFKCFVCESDTKVKAFQLKPHSQEPNRNIFGITTYLDSLEGHDFIDYNLIKIIVCPSCYFANANKELFKKSQKETCPGILKSSKFRSTWLKDIAQRESMFEGMSEEIFTINRSLPAVMKTYQLAIKTAETLAAANGDESLKWQAVTLMLNLSEILMSSGKVKIAEDYLNKANEKADVLFNKSSSALVSFRSARLLFIIALYYNDVRSAGPYLDFLRQYHHDKADSLAATEAAVLKKIFGETKTALENRSEYKKEQLIGFHRDI